MRAMILLLLLLIPAVSFAQEFGKNPDRYPSIGLSFGLFSQTGDLNVSAIGLSAKQDAEISQRDFTLDFRVPADNSFTLFGAVSVGNTLVNYKENNILAGSETSVSGMGFRIGGRYYFN